MNIRIVVGEGKMNNRSDIFQSRCRSMDRSFNRYQSEKGIWMRAVIYTNLWVLEWIMDRNCNIYNFR